MRRLALSFGLLSTLIAPMSWAAPPWSLPDAPVVQSRQTLLRDILMRSDFRPSAKAIDLAQKEGASHDGDAPFNREAPKQPLFADPQIQVVGEVAVMFGDDDIVTDFGNGEYGLRYDNAVQNPMDVTQRFIEQFGDEYDFIAVWTSFWDNGAEGLAYYVPIFNDVSGLGDGKYNQRQFWGVNDGGKLQGFLNMKSIEVYGNIRNENNYVYPVIGQEFSHRWLAQMQFQRANGQVSDATLGRDGAHWSTLLQADASVQDGNLWRDNGDGTFTLMDTMSTYSDLDLYGMGLLPPEEVDPFFLIENATYRGESYDGLTQWPDGVKINGTRTEITIDDIAAANGVRRPAYKDAQKDFRMAFILVTAPGQTVADVQDQIDTIEDFRAIWEAKYAEWTRGRSTMCTRVTAMCDRPALRFTNYAVREIEGDGDQMAEPGEKVAVSVTLSNNGGGTAEAPFMALTPPEGGGLTVGASPITLADIEAGKSAELETAFVVDIGPDVECGKDYTFKLEAASGELLVDTSVVVPIGYNFMFYDDFSTDRGWQVDAAGEDTAGAGVWERSVPTQVDAGASFSTQPGSGPDGDSGAVLVTGARRGNGLGAFDVDDGATSITSPSIPLADAQDPRIGFFSWRTGLDFNTDPNNVLDDDNDPLVTEISGDDGATWVRLDADISNESAWLEKSFRVLDFLPAVPSTLRLRFTMIDAEPQSLAEAAIDNVRVWDLQPSCYDAVVNPDQDPTVEPTPDGGSETTDPTTNPTNTTGGKKDDGCSGGMAEGLAVALAGLALMVARRRRV